MITLAFNLSKDDLQLLELALERLYEQEIGTSYEFPAGSEAREELAERANKAEALGHKIGAERQRRELHE